MISISRINFYFVYFLANIFILSVRSATDQELSNISLRLYMGKTIDDNYLTEYIGDGVKLLERFDPSKPTVFYIHGYTEDLNKESVRLIIGAYLKRQDHNVLAIDWSHIAARNYIYGAGSAEGVGKTIGKGLNEMVVNSLDSESIHVIGHSLGSQIAGYVGRNVDFKVPRITGLDPAGPGFHAMIERLTSSDANFVDVIHTDFGFYGISMESGGADFYPNEGTRIQPGCPYWFWPMDINDFCSHRRSFIYYAESVNNENSFIGIECDKSRKSKSKMCKNDHKVPMGFSTPFGTKGSFYLETRHESPYGLGDQEL